MILSIIAKLGSAIFVVSSFGTATLDIGVSVTVVVSGMTTTESVSENRSSWTMIAGRGLAA